MGYRKFVRRSFLALAGTVAIAAAAQSNAGILTIQPGSKMGAFRVERAESFKGITQVAIGQFSVAFMTRKVDYDGGGFLSAGEKAKATGYLTGISNAEYQRITNEAYADFLSQLSAHGITVVDGAGLTADKYYAKVKTEAQGEKVTVALKKDDKADALAFWPTALGRNNNMMLTLRMFDTNLSNTYTAQYNYARTAKVPVINVVYYVDFAKSATSSGGGMFQSITVKAGLAVSPFGTQVQLVDTNGKLGKMSLNVAVEEGGNFADIVETTSAATKMTHTVGVLGGALGHFGGGLGGFGKAASKMGGEMSARFDYRVTNPKLFGDKAIAASRQTTDLFVRQMEAMR